MVENIVETEQSPHFVASFIETLNQQIDRQCSQQCL